MGSNLNEVEIEALKSMRKSKIEQIYHAIYEASELGIQITGHPGCPSCRFIDKTALFCNKNHEPIELFSLGCDQFEEVD